MSPIYFLLVFLLFVFSCGESVPNPEVEKEWIDREAKDFIAGYILLIFGQ